MNKDSNDSQINIKISVGAEKDAILADSITIYNIGNSSPDASQTVHGQMSDVLKEGAFEALKVRYPVFGIFVEMFRSKFRV